MEYPDRKFFSRDSADLGGSQALKVDMKPNLSSVLL